MKKVKGKHSLSFVSRADLKWQITIDHLQLVQPWCLEAGNYLEVTTKGFWLLITSNKVDDND